MMSATLGGPGPADFRGWVFPGNFPFREVTGGELRVGDGQMLDFRRSRFLGPTQFGGVHFRAVTNFSGAVFEGPVAFESAVFSRGAIFGALMVSGDRMITEGVQFTDRVSFRQAKLESTSEFRSVEFGDYALFDDASFANVSFVESSFAYGASFRRVHIAERFVFNPSTVRAGPNDTIAFEPVLTPNSAFEIRDTTFESTTVLKASIPRGAVVSVRQTCFNAGLHIEDLSGEGGCTFEQTRLATSQTPAARQHLASFRDLDFPLTRFERVEFEQGVTFQDSNMERVTFRTMSLVGAHFRGSRNLEKVTLDAVTAWDCWPPIRNGKLPRLSPRRAAVTDEVQTRLQKGWPRTTTQRASDCAALARVYADLRTGLEARKQYHIALELYAGEMEMRRLGQSNWIERHLSMHALYGALSLYGARWMRPLIWLLTSVVVCALIYQFDGLHVRVRTVGSDGRLNETYREVKVDWASPADMVEQAPELANQWRDSLLHSALTASFIGREQVAVPASGLGLFVQTLESLLGPLLAGFMALAIRKRYSGAAADK